MAECKVSNGGGGKSCRTARKNSKFEGGRNKRSKNSGFSVKVKKGPRYKGNNSKVAPKGVELRTKITPSEQANLNKAASDNMRKRVTVKRRR